MTLREVREKLADYFDSVGYSRKGACFVAKRGYFYTHGMTVERCVDVVKTKFPGVVILDTSNHWNAWPRDSWFEVRFSVGRHHQEEEK